MSGDGQRQGTGRDAARPGTVSEVPFRRRVVPAAGVAEELPRVHHAGVERQPGLAIDGKRSPEARRHLSRRLHLALLEQPAARRQRAAGPVRTALRTARQRDVLRNASMIRCAGLAVAAAALVACGSPRTSGPASGVLPKSLRAVDVQPPEIHIAHRPPMPKDVIEAVIASGNVPLTVSASCRNAGTEPSDATIGRYLAGFLAEMSSPD